MKKILLLILCVMLTLGASAQFSGSGTGTESDPYRIYNPDQLNQIRNFLNKSGVYFSIEADIDLKEWIAENNPSQGWAPIGSSSSPFWGTIKGNNHVISNLTINRPNTDYVGFFAAIKSATISDITFTNNDVKGGDYTGTLSGSCDGANVSNIKFININLHGNSNTGGVIGYMSDRTKAKISNIKVYEQTVTGESKTGGLAGYIGSGILQGILIENGKINGNGNCIGGIAGQAITLEMSNCTATSKIITDGSDIGGLVGFFGDDYKYFYGGEKANISNCHFYGEIQGGDNIGGAVGRIINVCRKYQDQHNCYYHKISNVSIIAKITAKSDYVGGIVGKSYQTFSGDLCSNGLKISDSYFSGSILGANFIGGILGYIYSKTDNPTIINCYSYSSYIKGTGKISNGIVGYSGGAAAICVKSCIANNAEISGLSDVHRVAPSNISATVGTQTENRAWALTKLFENGEEKIAEDGIEHGTSVGLSTLKLQATYQGLGWDFENNWKIQDTECFPYKPTQTAPPYFTSKVVSGATTLSGKCIENGEVTVTIGDKEYKTTSSGYNWSVRVDALKTGEEIQISAQATDKLPSYYVYATVSPSGSGTEADPYQVFSAEDLQVIKMNSTDHYKLMNDIDLTSWISKNYPSGGWKPVGSTSAVLMASFDGNGHTISGLWTNTTDDYVGLFSRSNGSTIKNLTVKIVNGKQLKGGNYVGAISAYNNGNIENCKVIGDVSATGIAGGVAGFSSGTITTTTYSGNVTSSGTGCIGGIAGESTGNITKCSTVDGSVSASGKGAKAGGVCGKSSGTVENCYSVVPVTSSAEDNEVSAAGLVGYNEGAVSKCYASGNVESGYKGSGVVGYNYGSSATVSNLIGLNPKVSAKNSAFRVVGGFANGAASPGTDNKAIKSMVLSVNGVPQKIYDDPLNGYAIDDAKALQRSTYTSMGWDMSSTWTIDENSGYPYLRTSSTPVVTKTYTLTYKVDDVVYSTETHKEGDKITAIASPTKDGYTFSGWSNVPSTMPANDVTVTGQFTKNSTPSADDHGSVLKTGKCGDNATYTVYSDATLVISGTGAMYDYSSSQKAPWYDSHKTFVKNLVIETGITEIGDYAFYYCSRLASITIPNSVTSIGDHAFYGCSGLTSITIPNSVTSIGRYAFEDCSGLTSITIPNSVTSIGDYAFYGCSGLTSIVVENGNSVYDSRDNCNAIIKKSSNTLIAGCMNTVIPNSVTSIGSHAFFGCSGLTSITIPNSVTSIGNYAFYHCSSLTSITIPNSVTSIGYDAFRDCSGLTSITIPNSVTSIGGGAFRDCSGLTSIVVAPNNNVYDSRDNCNAIIEKSSNILIAGCMNTVIPNSVTRIGYSAFYGCSGLTSITIPNSVTSIGNYAFDGCSGLTSITIPNSVTSIGSYAFSGCSKLTDVYNYASTPQQLSSNSFSKYGTLHVKRGCKTAYENADYWKNFTIVEDLESDDVTPDKEDNGTYTYYNIIQEDLDPNNYCITTKDRYIIQVGEGSDNALCDDNGHLSGASISTTSEDISQFVWHFEESDTEGEYYMCTETGMYVTFTGRSTSYGTLSQNKSDACKIKIGKAYTPDLSKSYWGIQEQQSGNRYGLNNLFSYNIKFNWWTDEDIFTESMGDAFSLYRLKKVDLHAQEQSTGNIPNDEIWYTSSDGSIVQTTFGDGINSLNTMGLVSNTYENGKGVLKFDHDVTSIGNFAFHRCSGLTSITIPNSVTSIGRYAFEYCSGLTSITIPNSVTSIGDYAFGYCSGLTSITIPNSVTSIGSWAFYYCSGLTSITIPNSVTSIGSWAFSGCYGLTSIVVAQDNNVYDSRDNCNAIIEKSSNTLIAGCMNTVIPNSVTSIGNYAFEYCSGLTSITIPNSVTSIGSDAFYGCSGLTSITIPYSVTSIGSDAFSGCSGLTSITVAQGNEVYDSRDNCNAIIEKRSNTLIAGCKNTVIPNSVTSIGSHAFYGCSGLTSITIPNSVTSIGSHAFYRCFSLTSIIIPNSVTSVGNYAFSNCFGLTSITIPNSVTSIGSSAFYGCSKLTDVYNYASTPQQLSSDSFSKYGTLHVKRGCKTAYENADYWKNFTIVEDLESDEIIPVYVESVSLNKTSLELTTGDTSTLTASVMPSNADDKSILWSSSNTSVATVDDNGLVTAIAAGTATITVTAADGNGAKATCNVTVTAPAPETPSEVTATDLTKFDNVLYIESAEANVGGEATLSLKMNNKIPMTGFQCDVVMPEGVNYAMDDEFYMIDLSTARTTTQKTNTFDSSRQSDGSVRILCGSTRSYTFSGTEGEVATIKVNIDDNATEGELPLILKGIVMSDATGKTYKVDQVTTVLTLSNYTLGDANNDGDVNIGDYTTIANHILGNDAGVFIEKAADVNCDTEINVGDLTSLANLILNGSSTGAKASYAKRLASTNPSGYENIIYASSVSMAPGETQEISVKMKNAVPMTGFQFDIVMPNGISIDMDDVFYNIALSTERTTARKTNTFDSALQSDGSVRVLCGSTKSYTFDGYDGEVATIAIKSDASTTSGTYTVTLKNIVMSDATGKTYKIDASDIDITVSDNATGISYDSIDQMKDGKYIINRHLVIKKGNRIYSANGEIIK